LGIPLNPMAIKHAIDVKNWLADNPIKCVSKFIDVQKSKDGKTYLAIFEFGFATEKEAQMFKELYELAQKFGV
jgi:hypothetical protein